MLLDYLQFTLLGGGCVLLGIVLAVLTSRHSD